MPDMVAQQHMGYYDARRQGAARTEATLAAAISAIGSTPTMLVVSYTGDGVWTIGSNLTSPAHITLYIPPGVTINVATGVTLTINGGIISYNPNWATGPGTIVRGTGTAMEFSTVKATSLAVNQNPASVPAIQVTAPGSVETLDFTLYPTLDVGGGLNVPVPRLNLIRDPANHVRNWQISNHLSYMLNISHTGSGVLGQGHIGLTDTGLWVGNGSVVPAPTHLLHLQLDDAFKPGDGTWDFPSDQRLKNVVRPYTDGLAMLQALPAPIVYTWNGKANTPVDGTEYIGMIGQDVQPVAPYMINTYQDKLEPTDPEPTDILQMNDSSMTYALLNAVRELADRVEALEATIATLNGHGPQVAEASAEHDETASPRASRRRRH